MTRPKKTTATTLVFFLTTFFILPGFAAQKGVDKNIGLYLELTTTEPEQANTLREAFIKEFSAMYGRSVKEFKPASGSPFNKSPESVVFIGAASGIDHMVAFEGEGDVKFGNQKKRKAEFLTGFRGKAWVIDVAGMKRVLQKEINVTVSGKLEDVAPEMFVMAAYQELAKKMYGDIASIYNPSIMKRLNVREIADYFYGRGDCARAFPLYERAEIVETRLDILEEVTTRKIKCQKKIKGQKQ